MLIYWMAGNSTSADLSERVCQVDERGTGTRGESHHSSICSRRQAAATGDLAATTPVVAEAARRELSNRPIAADATISATRTPPESRTQPRGAPVRGRATPRTTAGALRACCQRIVVLWLAGCQPLDDAQLEPVVVIDSEPQLLHVPDRAAPEVLSLSRDAYHLDQRLR